MVEALVLILIAVGYGLYKANQSPARRRQTFGRSSPAPSPTKPLELTSEMMQPIDEDIKANDAARIFREFMLKTGILDKDEISDHVQMLRDEMKDHTDALRDDLTSSREELVEYKATLKNLKAELKHAEGEEREDIEAEIEDIEGEIENTNSEIETAKAEVAAYQKDKRAFLIEYVNRQYMNS
jgi:septal ring factor EnvC (AmiA/AmiB activator)